MVIRDALAGISNTSESCLQVIKPRVHWVFHPSNGLKDGWCWGNHHRCARLGTPRATWARWANVSRLAWTESLEPSLPVSCSWPYLEFCKLISTVKECLIFFIKSRWMTWWKTQPTTWPVLWNPRPTLPLVICMGKWGCVFISFRSGTCFQESTCWGPQNSIIV